ncbi:MAG: glycoside hydrolase family 15 protein [Planctomycetota bacterium]
MTIVSDNPLAIREDCLAEDAGRVLEFLQERGTFRFPTLNSGLFSAAAGDGAEFDVTGYRSVWVRDNVHIAHAHLVWGERDKAIAAMVSLMSYFAKHRHRFTDAITGRSDPNEPMHRPHIRFDGERLEELNEKWSHAQNDALGAFLWLYSKLALAGHVKPSRDEALVLADIAEYFRIVRYWQDEDSGHWEEVRKVAASSIGVATAGLIAYQDWLSLPTGSNFSTSKFVADAASVLQQTPAMNHTDAGSVGHGDANLEVLNLEIGAIDLVEDLCQQGLSQLRAILPWECRQDDPAQRRRHDAALLFLIYPYCVVDGTLADEIAGDVTSHLMGDHGIRRYLGDSYWCADYKDKLAADQRTADFSDNLAERDRLLEPGLEAQWCLFDPILSIHYGLRRERTGESEDRRRQVHHLNRSLGQLTSAGSRFGAYRCPESYFREQGRYVPNDICPLLWTQANLKLALWFASGRPVLPGTNGTNAT